MEEFMNNEANAERKTIGEVWGMLLGAVYNMCETVSVGTKAVKAGAQTADNLLSTAEEHSAHFKSTSLAELKAKETEKAIARKARITELREK
jgi:hypothetical protein